MFERDESAFVSRGQGYVLTIDANGNRALHACLPPRLYDLVVATSGEPGHSFTIYNERTEVLQRLELPRDRHAADTDVTRQVDRFTLRQILLGGLSSQIHFRKAFVRYDEDGDRVVAHFEDGTSVEGDVLIGSDGIHSRVRQQLLPHAVVADTSLRAIFGRTPLLTRGD